MRAVAALATLLLACAPAVRAAPADETSPSRVQAWLEERLSAAVRGEVRFGSFDWSLTELSARFSDFRLSIPVDGASPLTASAASGRIRLAWSGVAGLLGGRVRIAEIVLEAPRFETSSEAVEALARRASPGRPVDVEVRRVEVRGGVLRYIDRDDGLDVALTDLAYEGVWDDYRRALEGPMSGRGTVVHPPIARALPFDTRGTLRVSPRSLEFVAVEAAGRGMKARLDGRLLLRGQVAFAADVAADADLAALSSYLDPKFPAIEGTARATLRIDKGGPGFSVLGRASASAARLGPLRATAAAAAFALRPGLLEIRALDAAAYGGSARGEIDVFLGDPVRIRTRISGAGLDVEPLLALAGLTLPLGARGDGTFEVEGEPGTPSTWTGRARIVAEQDPAPRGRVPAAADGEIVFGEAHARIAAMRTEIAAARLSLDLDADLSSRPVAARLALSGATSDAAATHGATMRLMESLGVHPPALAREPLTGAGDLAAVITVGPRPGLDLDLDLANGSFSGEAFDRAALVLRYDGREVAVEKLEATRGTASLAARLRFGADGALDEAEGKASGLPAASLLRRAGADVDVDGLLDGELRAARREGVLRGEGRATLREATVYGERVDEASAPVALDGDVLTIAPLTARGPALEASATVTVALDEKTASGTLDAAEIRPERIALLERAGLSASGFLTLDGPFRWSAAGPDARLRVGGHDLVAGKPGSSIARATIGEPRGTLTLAPGEARVDLADAAGKVWTARARLGLGSEFPVEATIRLSEASFDVASGGAGSVQIGVSTELHVTGPLARPEDLGVEGTLEHVTLRLGARVLEAEAPVSLSLSGGRLTLGSAVLRDESSRVETRIALVPATGAIDAEASGTLDVSVLNALVPGIRATGQAAFAVSARGTLEAPALGGRLDVKGARLRIPGFPQPLDEVELAARLEDARVLVDRFEAQCGGGALRGAGSATLSGGTIASYEGTLDVERVAIPYPGGFKGVYEGRLRLEGTPSLGRLGGKLSLVRGLYGEDIDVLSLVTSTSRAALPDDESSLPRNVLLDVAIVADGNVWMRNNLGRIETRVDLAVGGTMARPEVTGRLELFEGGTFRFRDVEYRIESGTIDLADPGQIRPILDLRGTTRVKDVEIDLHIEGPADRIRYELTSNPPLSEQDIIGMLLTGRTFEDVTAAGGAAALTGDVAANYFAGALTARFGRQLGKALGLDRFQIDPLLVENGADPTTRVTIGKQLGPRAGFIYSTTLGATKEQSYQLEVDVSRRFQLLAETSTEAGVGGDLRYTDRFGGDPAALPSRRPARARTGGPHVASVAIEGAPPDVTARLLGKLPLRAGAPYSRAALYEGSEALRRELVAQGRIESRVETRVRPPAPDPASDEPVDVVYEIELGPVVDVRVEGSGWRDRMRQSRKLQRFWANSLYSPDLYHEGEEILVRDVQLRGYFAADVDHVHGEESGGRRRVVFDVDRGEKVRVKAIRILGTSGISEERVRAQMLTKAGGLSFGRRVLDPLVLEEDVRAIRAMYRNEGFLGVRIEGPMLRLSPEGDEATVTLRIDEGRRWVVGRVEAPTDLPVSSDLLRSWSGLVPGRVFSPAAVLEAEGAIRAKLDAQGFPDAVVEALYALQGDVANVTLHVTTGPLKRVGSIEIAGNRRTKPKIIRREIGLAPGDPLSREKLLDAQQKLYRLGIFRSVRFEDAPAAGGDPADRVVTVRVQEAAPIGFSLGPGYDSETGARLSFSLRHDNLDGYDRSVAFQGRWSGAEKRLQIVGREPRLFNRRIAGLAAFSWEKEEETGFTTERRSTAVRLERKIDRRWTRFIRYNFQRVDVTPDPTITAEQLEDLLRQRLTNVRLGDVGLAFVRDTRDDPFLATRGGYASAELRVFAKQLLSDETFAKLSVGGSLTRTFPRGTSFSVALRIGAAEPFGSTESVPLSERFFAGGESTVRGFERDSLGPSYSDLTGTPGLEDVPVGGEGLLVINEEWRVPLWRGLRGVVFIDTGNVFFRLEDLGWRDLRESAGLGLRYDTPIGPLRVEYGWKLDRREGESPGELHLAIGSVF